MFIDNIQDTTRGHIGVVLSSQSKCIELKISGQLCCEVQIPNSILTNIKATGLNFVYEKGSSVEYKKRMEMVQVYYSEELQREKRR